MSRDACNDARPRGNVLFTGDCFAARRGIISGFESTVEEEKEWD